MATPTHSRKQQFKIALAVAGTTATAWAREQDITLSHLYAVLSGERESKTLNERITAYITKYAAPLRTNDKAA